MTLPPAAIARARALNLAHYRASRAPHGSSQARWQAAEAAIRGLEMNDAHA